LTTDPVATPNDNVADGAINVNFFFEWQSNFMTASNRGLMDSYRIDPRIGSDDTVRQRQVAFPVRIDEFNHGIKQ